MTNITIQERKDIKDKNKRFRYVFHYKNKRYRGGGFPTKAIARQKAREHLEQLENNDKDTLDILFKDEYKHWFENIKLPRTSSLSKGQMYWYEYSLKLFNEYFGEDRRINDISKIEYQNFLSWYGQGRTKSSVEKVHVCISQCLKYAHSEGIIKIDPTFQATTTIRGSKATMIEDDKFLDTDEYLELIEYFRSRKERSYLLLFILAITGGRFSEVNKLTREDLKIDSIHLRGTKSKSSDRVVGISENDMAHILNTIEQHPKRSDGLLFNLAHRSSVKSFNYALKELNINKKRTPYSLRHTHCSYLISKQIPIDVISKRMGHTNTRITQEVYAHVLDKYNDEHTQKIRDLFS